MNDEVIVLLVPLRCDEELTMDVAVGRCRRIMNSGKYVHLPRATFIINSSSHLNGTNNTITSSFMYYIGTIILLITKSNIR